MADGSWGRGLGGRMRAAAMAVGWVVIGVFVRWRFRLGRCDDVEGGWAMVLYVCVTLVLFLLVNAREGLPGGRDGDSDDPTVVYERRAHRFGRTQRRLSWLTAFAVVVIAVSALAPYADHVDACTS